MGKLLVNPTDILDALVLLDQITDALRTTRAGLRSTRRNWRTSSSGLLPAARAASSLAALTEECSALLLFMVTGGGEPSPDLEMRPSPRSTTSSRSWTPELDDDDHGDELE